MAGVLAFVAHRFGEARLEDCYRAVLEPYIQERYMVFDTRETPSPETLERNRVLLAAVESLPSGAAVIDALKSHRPLTYVNPAFLRMTALAWKIACTSVKMASSFACGYLSGLSTASTSPFSRTLCASVIPAKMPGGPLSKS